MNKGDGFADVVIGAIGVGVSAGSASLYLGGPGGLSPTPTVLTGPGGMNGSFGYSVASAGDVNGDGFADVVVGAYDDTSVDCGHAYVYLGGAGGLSTTPIAVAGPIPGLSDSSAARWRARAM